LGIEDTIESSIGEWGSPSTIHPLAIPRKVPQRPILKKGGQGASRQGKSFCNAREVKF
jgi:hypothetical protein